MGDFLCRLTYFQYTGATLEQNMDRRLWVGNDKTGGNDSSERQNSGIGCQLISGSGQWFQQILITNIYSCSNK